MKNNFLYLRALFLFLMLVHGALHTQGQPTLSADQAARLVEKTRLITDRHVYCVQEDILFSAFNVSSLPLRQASWSNVLYVELISPGGETFARGKYAYGPQGASGRLQIPREALTGNYYLRAYTRWMRDYSPYGYYYQMITVINPFRPELLEKDEWPATSLNGAQKAPYSPLEASISTDKQSYAIGEQVNLEISALSPTDSLPPLTVAVIPQGAEIPLTPDLPELEQLSFSPGFIPETRGLSLSGRVTNSLDSLPLPYTMVGLTIFKENPESRIVRTNEKGQFFFDLGTLEGEYELFISAKSNEKQKPLIWVDNDFSTPVIQLPYVPVNLSKEALDLYQRLSFNSQLNEHFKEQPRGRKVPSMAADTSFYGQPDAVLYLKEFIAMATIKDYIIELMPQVGIRQQEKTTVLKVLGPHSDLSFYDPLVLIDRIPVFDIERILAIPPQKIERIEVVSVPYVRGDIVFGGIISFFSKKGDLAGIDIPSSGRFITYPMLSGQQAEGAPPPANARLPLLSNCLYWNPSLIPVAHQPVSVSFNAGQQPGRYLVVVQSSGNGEEIKRSTVELVVE